MCLKYYSAVLLDVSIRLLYNTIYSNKKKIQLLYLYIYIYIDIDIDIDINIYLTIYICIFCILEIDFNRKAQSSIASSK